MGHTDTIQTNKYTAHIPSITVSHLGAEVKRFLQQISQHTLISGRRDTKCSRQTWSDQETQDPLSVQYSPHSYVHYSPHSSVQYSPHSSVQYSRNSSRPDSKKHSLVPAWSVPYKGQNNKRKTFPNQSRYPGQLHFKESISLPLAGGSFHDLHSLLRTNKSFSNRPLPLTPDSEDNENKIKAKRNLKRNPQNLEDSKKFSKRDQRRKKEPLQRTTVYSLPNKIKHSEESSSQLSLTDLDEDHIYEEIVEEESNTDSDDDTEKISFLTLISSERRKNLIFYGCTDWDFGT